ncbi:MAG: MFS transporter, partial [Devosiaceae bacterium]
MTTSHEIAQAADSLSQPPAGRKGIAGWVLFDAAMQPWFALVTTFVFGPYVVSALAASPAQGQ